VEFINAEHGGESAMALFRRIGRPVGGPSTDQATYGELRPEAMPDGRAKIMIAEHAAVRSHRDQEHPAKRSRLILIYWQDG
jgi:hypothetical protein